MSRNVIVHKTLPTQEELHMKDTVSAGKLILTNFQNMLCGFLIQGNRLTAVRCYKNAASQFGIGSIYIGRIKDVSKNIHAYFVEIQKGIIAYLPDKAAVTPNIINRVYDGRLLCGDEILVQITKDAQNGKRMQVTTMLQFEDSEQNLELLLQTARHKTCYSCIQQSKPCWYEIFDHMRPCEYDEIITDIPEIYEELKKRSDREKTNHNIRLYEDNAFSLTKLYSLETRFQTAVERCIWLKSGAFLIIEPTEAMTVIDVNSGKYEGKRQDDSYYYTINLEAAEEIALQLRLRSISGIIIVDFINMKLPEQKTQLIERMKSLLAGDICKCTVVDMTPLGLMEITRKKIYKPLSEQIEGKA